MSAPLRARPLSSPPRRLPGRADSRIGLGLVGILLAGFILAFYFWTALPPSGLWRLQPEQGDYYGLLSHGFLHGHTYMNAAPHPDLFSPDPNVRNGAPILLDASLHDGRYYLYFGVTPVLVLLVPWRLLTGLQLPEGLAAALLGSAGFLLAVALLWQIRRRCFPESGLLPWLAVVLAAGLSTALPAALRHGAFYELAVCAAFAFAMLLFLSAWLALTRKKTRALWFMLASLSYGLLVGSRPNLAFSGLLLPLLVFAVWFTSRRAERGVPQLWRGLLCAGLPAALCLAGLAAYNAARFGSPFDFGYRYQVGSNATGVKFSLPFLWHNLQLYYFTLPEFSLYFPFFSPGREGPVPAGYFGIEQVHGQFYMAVLGLLVAAGLVGTPQVKRISPPLRILGALLVLWWLINGALMAAAPVRADRYSMDFHPALILLAAIGLLAAAGPRLGWRRLALGGAMLVVAGSAFYNAMASMGTEEFFRQNRPPAYRAVAHAFNQAAFWSRRRAENSSGPIRLTVSFPHPGPPNPLEPLVTTGSAQFPDILFIQHTGAGSIRFVLQHGSLGIIFSPYIPVVYDRPYEMEIDLGSFYPPEAHPFFDSLSLAQMRWLKRSVAITLDGAPVFRGTFSFYDASPGQIYLGENPFAAPGEPARFRGRVAYRGRTPPDVADLKAKAQSEAGPVALRLMLPARRTGLSEPLVITGTTTRSDILFIEYVDERHVRFHLDHWGEPMISSPLLACDYAKPHMLEARMGSLYPPEAKVDAAVRRQFSVRWDGREVVAGHLSFYPADPLTVDVGGNAIASSSCRPLFSGQILAFQRGESGAPIAAAGEPIGPKALALLFPLGAAGRTQPLATVTSPTGHSWLICARYTAGAIQLGMLGEAGLELSEPIPLDYESAHTLLVGLPGKEIAPSHPLATYWNTRAPNRFWLALDGRLVFERTLPSLAEGGMIHWGRNLRGSSPECEDAYTGVLDFNPGFASSLPPIPQAPVKIALRLPRNRPGHREPLLTTGVTGGGDCVYVDYVDETHVRLGYDHWGAGGPISERIAVPADTILQVTLSLGSFYSAVPPDQRSADQKRLWVEINGTRVWAPDVASHPIPAGHWYVGSNPISISTCEAVFQGEILTVATALPGRR